MFRITLICSFILWLSSCTSSTIVTGKVAEEIDFREVVVFYTTSPDCEFNVIAHIDIPGEYYNRASLIDGFRKKAAAIGAPAVYITYLQKAGTHEFYGSATAIRCTNQPSL